MLASLPSSFHRKSEPEQEKQKRREICRIVMIGETVKTSQRRKAHYMEGMKNKINDIEGLRKEGTLAFESEAYFIPFISRLPLFSRPAQEGVRRTESRARCPQERQAPAGVPVTPKRSSREGIPSSSPPRLPLPGASKKPLRCFCLRFPSSSRR